MKQLLMGLMLLITATAASAEWIFVAQTDQMESYVDDGTIRRSSQFVKLWVLTNFRDPYRGNGDSYLSSKSQNEYDCKEGTFRNLAIVYFVGRMGNGRTMPIVDEMSLKWRAPAPGTVGEKNWKIACGMESLKTDLSKMSKIGETDEYISYLNPIAKRRDRTIVMMTSGFDYKKPNTASGGTTFLSAVYDQAYHCGNESSGILSETLFGGQMGRGEMTASIGAGKYFKWAPIPPGSLSELILKVACGKQ